MPKVQMAAVISGTRDGKDWPAPGELIDVPEAEAKQLVEHGLAKVPDKKGAKPEPEKATARKPETRKGLTTKDV